MTKQTIHCYLKKNESLQYNAASAITSTIGDLSKEKLHQISGFVLLKREDGWENLTTYIR